MFEQSDATRHPLSDRDENERFIVSLVGYVCVMCGASAIWGFGGFFLSLGSLLIVIALNG